MNMQEREQLTHFLHQLAQTQAGAKDAEAAAMIAATFSHHADAPYLVVQRALLLDAAIHNADAQIAQLKAQVAQLTQQQRAAAPAGGFLDATTWGRQPAPLPSGPSAPSATTLGSAPFQASPQYASAQNAPAARGFQAPSFLSSLAGTAAGVAAGAFLFQGINHLVGGQHPAAAPDAHSLASPAEDTASPPSNLLDAPADTQSLADSSSAGFSELLDIGPDDSGSFGDAGDSSDWS